MSAELIPYSQNSPDVKRVPFNPDVKRPVINLDEDSYKIKNKTTIDDDIILVGIAVDDSSSIKEFKNKEDVIKGHNSVIESLKNSTVREKILFKTQLFSEQGALNNWIPLDDAKNLIAPDEDKGIEGNYKTESNTPLYDASYKILANADAERKSIINKANKQARFGVMIISDGEDCKSERYTAKNVEEKVKKIMSENDPERPNTISFMGLPNPRVNYIDIANSMGIENQRPGTRSEQVMQILTPTSDQRSIRRAFEIFSKSITR